MINKNIAQAVAAALILLFVSHSLAFGYEYSDGVLTSGQPQDISSTSGDIESSSGTAISNDIQALIEDYVQQVVINSVLSKVGDIMKRAIQSQNLQIFPQVAYSAIQQASLEIFKQDQMKEITQQAYNESKDYAIKAQEDGASQATIQSTIQVKVNSIIDPIQDEPIFRNIVEHYLKQAAIQNQKIIVQTVTQRQAQLLAIKQQEAAILAAIQKQYIQAVQQQAVQQQYMNQLQKGVY